MRVNDTVGAGPVELIGLMATYVNAMSIGNSHRSQLGEVCYRASAS